MMQGILPCGRQNGARCRLTLIGWPFEVEAALSNLLLGEGCFAQHQKEIT